MNISDTSITRKYIHDLVEKVKNIEIRHYRYWVEDFQDEETGEIVKLDRYDLLSIEQTCSDEKKNDMAKELIHALTLWHQLLTRDELAAAYHEIIWPEGNDAANRQLLVELSESGFSDATWDLLYGYTNGDELKGINKDRALARKYMELYVQRGYDENGHVAELLSDFDNKNQ